MQQTETCDGSTGSQRSPSPPIRLCACLQGEGLVSHGGKVCLAGLRRGLLGFPPKGEPVTWSLVGLLDLEGILGLARIYPGHPSGLFLFASAGCAGPGGRWDCGGGEEQQVVSAGVSAVPGPWGMGESRVGMGQLERSSLGGRRGWGGTARVSGWAASYSTILISSLIISTRKTSCRSYSVSLNSEALETVLGALLQPFLLSPPPPVVAASTAATPGLQGCRELLVAADPSLALGREVRRTCTLHRERGRALRPSAATGFEGRES